MRKIPGLLVLCLAVAAAFVSSGAAGTHVFHDTVGDNPGGLAADIQDITVTDDAAGVVTFRVETPNVPTHRDRDLFVLDIDVDGNSNTGIVGSDIEIRDFGEGVKLARASGSNFDESNPPPSFSGSWDHGLTASVKWTEVGGASHFRFFVYTAWDGGNGDYFPNAATSGERQAVDIGVSTPDTDRDGLPDSVDACPKVPAGKYDKNKNGCPGPFSAINPKVPGPSAGNARTATFGPAVIRKMPAGSSLLVRIAGRQERRAVGRSGAAQSSLLAHKTFPVGTRYTVQVTHPGWIGFVGEFQLTAVAPGFRQVKRMCTRPTGRAIPVSCAAVSRGK